MPSRPLRDVIAQVIVLALHDLGDDMFSVSQKRVPVDRGTLKKSGVLRKVATGFEIGYRTPYARVVEFGYPAHTQTVRAHMVSAHLVKTYIRNGRWKKEIIRAHSVSAHHVSQFTRNMPKREGRYFLTSSFLDAMPRLKMYLVRYLNKVGSTEVSFT